MKPYYEDDLVTLYHGDCREFFASLEDSSVDCVITDPPYTERTHGQAKTNKGAGHGVKAIDFKAFTNADLLNALRESGRVTRRWVVTSLDYAHAFEFDQNPPPGLRSLRVGIWVKSGVWTHPVVQNEGHPTVKPLPMVADWVRLFTNPGDTILDPFVGSGTTLRAAKDEGRKAIGVELDERYCEVIAKRLSQDTLFGGVA